MGKWGYNPTSWGFLLPFLTGTDPPCREMPLAVDDFQDCVVYKCWPALGTPLYGIITYI